MNIQIETTRELNAQQLSALLVRIAAELLGDGMEAKERQDGSYSVDDGQAWVTIMEE